MLESRFPPRSMRAQYGAWLAILTIPLLALPGSAVGAQSALIQNVALSRGFFNPTLGQKVNLSFVLREPGSLTVTVLDRDGYVIRHLVRASRSAKGPRTVAWNGRDDRSTPVPDEAYSFKVDFAGHGVAETYFPANRPGEELRVETKYYDRRSAVLSYRLPKPARVHLQAGTAIVDPRTKATNGPVLRTLVNREPRPAGAVVENWNGMDESGTTYVPDMPRFVIGIAASSLPENSIITYGNRTTSFPAWAAKRGGTPLITPAGADHSHHQGLTTLDDVAPRLDARVQNATWSARARTWSPRGQTVNVQLALTGPSAASFARHPGRLVVYLDEELVQDVPRPTQGMTLRISTKGMKPGSHLAALNWASAYGPVAVQTIPIQIGELRTDPAAAGGGSR